jgi:hypothetical protein
VFLVEDSDEHVVQPGDEFLKGLLLLLVEVGELLEPWEVFGDTFGGQDIRLVVSGFACFGGEALVNMFLLCMCFDPGDFDTVRTSGLDKVMEEFPQVAISLEAPWSSGRDVFSF